jgi:hypothetical protein
MRQQSDATSLDADTSPYSELGRELERSRRYERSFSLVRVRAEGAGQEQRNGTVSALKDRRRVGLRSIDRVWTLGDDLVYLLPECDRGQAEGFVKRIEALEGHALSGTIASFPEDGVTGGSLVELLLGESDALSGQVAGSTNGNNDHVNGTSNGATNGTRGFSFWRRRQKPEIKDNLLEWTPFSATPVAGDTPHEAAPLRAADKASR